MFTEQVSVNTQLGQSEGSRPAEIPYEEMTIRQALRNRKDNLERAIQELTEVETKFPQLMDMKRKDFQAFWQIV